MNANLSGSAISATDPLSSTCQTCGKPTSQPHHRLCADCWREDQDRGRQVHAQTVGALRAIESRFEEMHWRLVALEQAVDRVRKAA